MTKTTSPHHPKAFVLLSGGLDSTTLLHKAALDFRPPNISEAEVMERLDRGIQPRDGNMYWVEGVSIDYGQRHIKETDYAIGTCTRLGLNHHTIHAQGILGSSAMLTDKNVQIPDIKYEQIQGVSPTYVPYRNGTMLSILTAYAQQWVNSLGKWDPPIEDAAGIYFGAHAEDAANWAYPDCTPEFIGAQANAIYIGSYKSIRLYTPFMWLQKFEIVQLGHELSVDFAHTWSCYKGEFLHCGQCPTCYARQESFRKAGVQDPTQYFDIQKLRVRGNAPKT